VHLVVVPQRVDSLAQALKQTHGRYDTSWNATHRFTGHVWQRRFYSCPPDNHHLWIPLRYVELNPVRAGLVVPAQPWPWSSAIAHSGCEELDTFLAMEQRRKRWSRDFEGVPCGRQHGSGDGSDSPAHAHRSPAGGDQFVHSLEQATRRSLAPQKGGRSGNSLPLQTQTRLVFEK